MNFVTNCMKDLEYSQYIQHFGFSLCADEEGGGYGHTDQQYYRQPAPPPPRRRPFYRQQY